MSLRDDILNFADLRTEDVVVPEWGGVTVRVKELSIGEQMRFHNLRDQYKDDTLALAAVFVCHDLEGKPLFTLEDIPALSSKSGSALKRIYDAADRVSATDEDELKKK